MVDLLEEFRVRAGIRLEERTRLGGRTRRVDGERGGLGVGLGPGPSLGSRPLYRRVCSRFSLGKPPLLSNKPGRRERRASVSEREPGAMEKAKGMAKEAAGKVMGDEQRKAEGREEREGSEGHRAYFRKVIEETNERASGNA